MQQCGTLPSPSLWWWCPTCYWHNVIKPNWCHNAANPIINITTHDEWLWSWPGQYFFSDTNAALFCNLYHNHLWDMFLQVLTCTLTISLILVLTSILTHLLKYILTYSLTSFVTNSLANLLTVWHTLTLPLTFILIVSLIILLIMLFANISIFWQVPVPIARATSCRRHWCTLTGGE